jgi:hypothetical protein
LTIPPRVTYGEAMQKPLRIIIMFFAFLTIITFSSCGNKIETVHILTDRKELASAVEIYDALDESTIITIRHIPVIDAGIIESEKPDLVIGSDLSSTEIIDLLRPSEKVFPIYKALSGPSDSRGRSYLTPLSFKLPLIMGRKSTMAGLPDSMVVRPKDLREAALPHTQSNDDGRLTHLGFSPTWSPLSYIDLLAIRNPTVLDEGLENIDEESLTKTVEEVRNWIVEAAGNLDADTEFTQRYRYIPDEYLILQDRILFARTEFAAWASLPDTTARKLDIRYFSGPRMIPVTSIIAAGIPLKAEAAESAAIFVSWLMLPETQSNLLSRWERDGIPVFGIFGGLSSLPDVNNAVLIRYFPEMRDMIPEGHNLSVQKSLPHRWSRIRNEVISPWFQTAVSNPENPESLTRAYRKWDLSSLAEGD